MAAYGRALPITGPSGHGPEVAHPIPDNRGSAKASGKQSYPLERDLRIRRFPGRLSIGRIYLLRDGDVEMPL